jgi:NTE family protein
LHRHKGEASIFKRPISLALGGGGARGFAHIGVLRILERENIPIKGIAGTSMGAIVGALYAQKQNSHRVEEALKDFIQSPLFQNTTAAAKQQKKPTSFLDFMAIELCEQLKDSVKMRQTIQRMDQEMQQALDLLLGTGDIYDCRLPFAAIASDLRTGSEIVLTTGPISRAVFASAAMPGVFSPVSIDGYLLSDGAATSAVPIRAARSMWPRTKVLAVDVSSKLSTFPPLDNALQIVLRSSAISGHCYHNELVKEADILLQPHVKLFSWSEFDSFEDFVAEGEQAAIKALKKIKRTVRLF